MGTLGTLGKYELLRRLAIGGMAEIFLARQTGMQGFEKLVVIKRILPQLSNQERFIQMFLNEARLAARFNHPNVVQIYDLGEQDHVYFIAMEFVHGVDVKSLVKRCAPRHMRIPVEHVIKVMSGVLDGLHYAHTQTDLSGEHAGVVHRDISPQNIIVSFQGGVKLLDFGIAKAATQISTTIPGRVKGKHAYMSPEQCQGHELDPRSDIFSAGIVLYELITWNRLFKRNSDYETLRAVTSAEIPPPRGLNPNVSPKLESIALRALQRDRDKRFQTAQEMQIALEDCLLTEGLKSNSALISRFMQELFSDRLAVMSRALLQARADNLESAVLAKGQQGPDLVSFLNSFFGETASSSEPSEVDSDDVELLSDGPDSDLTPPPRNDIPKRRVQNTTQPALPAQAKTQKPLPKAPPAKKSGGMDLLDDLPADKPRTTVKTQAPATKAQGAQKTRPQKAPAGREVDILDQLAGVSAKQPADEAGDLGDPDALLGDPFLSKKKSGKSMGLLMVVIIGILLVGGISVLVYMGKDQSTPEAKGTLKVTSVPEGAEVFLDDRLQDQKTPMELKLKPNEEHALRLEIPKFPSWEQKFTIIDVNKPLEVNAVLDPSAADRKKLGGGAIVAEAPGNGQGMLAVESIPPGALIYLDGISTERKTPAVLQRVPAELDHVVILEAEGKLPAYERIRVSLGQQAKVSVTLLDGAAQSDSRTSVRISSTPEGAKVTVNDWPLQKPTPLDVKLLDNGPSEIVVELPGHQPWKRTVRPAPGMNLTFSPKLRKK